MNVSLRKRMSQKEFLTWAEGQEGRYEFDGFQPVAMTGGSNNHGAICRNLNGQLYLRLRGQTCQSMTAEGGGVATIGNQIRFPDATVTCSPIAGTDRLIPNPVVVFEVVSPTSAQTDEVTKLLEYQAVLSIRRYVLIAQTGVKLTVHARRQDDSWSEAVLGAGDTLDIPEIGIEILVDDIFEGLTFE